MLQLDRKKLVEELLMHAGAGAEREAAILNEASDPDLAFISRHLRNYVLKKYMLPPDCQEDNIYALARESLKVTLKIDSEVLHRLDQATPCNQATSESTKKVMLLYAVQRDLHLPENPAALSAVQTVSELGQYVYQNWQHRRLQEDIQL